MAEPQNLHEHAVAAEKHLEALATGLGQAGAPDEAVQTVTKMADVTRKLVVALGKGQEETGDQEPPPPEATPEEGPAAPEQPHTMESATAELHAEAQRRAKQRAVGG